MAQSKTISSPRRESEFRDAILSELRIIELQSRLLLLASEINGFQLQAADARSLGLLMADCVSKVKDILSELSEA
jgi:hypothetical protein